MSQSYYEIAFLIISELFCHLLGTPLVIDIFDFDFQIFEGVDPFFFGDSNNAYSVTASLDNCPTLKATYTYVSARFTLLDQIRHDPCTFPFRGHSLV